MIFVSLPCFFFLAGGGFELLIDTFFDVPDDTDGLEARGLVMVKGNQ